MKNKKEWQTKSLEWIHRVREKIDEEIRKKGGIPAQWIKARGKIDVEMLRQKLGLKNLRSKRIGLRYILNLRVRQRKHGIFFSSP